MQGGALNAPAPGVIDTPLSAVSEGAYWDKVQAQIQRAIRPGRIGGLPEVAAVVAFLPSDGASSSLGRRGPPAVA
jgi:NAD(P)-dependent dehydrogenase (short-subunit alcohol dehydrogenase family)